IPKSLGDVLDLLPSALKSCPLLLACPAAASCLQQLLTCKCEDPTTTPKPTTKPTPPPLGPQQPPGGQPPPGPQQPQGGPPPPGPQQPQGGPPPPGPQQPQGGPPPPGPQQPAGGPSPGGPPPQGPLVPGPISCVDRDPNCPNMLSYCMNWLYRPLMTANCQRTCGTCGIPSNALLQQQACTDEWYP
ncbi:repeat antigen 1, partial [Aphelenchoides avenae]